jgi:hypothetical protein
MAADLRQRRFRHEEAPMSSLLWIVLAFLGGGMAGVFLMALMRVAAEAPVPLRSPVLITHPRRARASPARRR